MGKFKKGNWIFSKGAVPGFGHLWEVVSSDEKWVRIRIENGGIISREVKGFQLYEGGSPDEITHNGVTYIRKPEPEHVWKFGDWARLKNLSYYEGKIAFVTGPVLTSGFVPVVIAELDSDDHCDGIRPEYLEYISSAPIPE